MIVWPVIRSRITTTNRRPALTASGHFQRTLGHAGGSRGREHVLRDRVGGGDHLDAAHEAGLHQDVGAHLPRADEANADRAALALARLQGFGDGGIGLRGDLRHDLDICISV